MNIRILSDLHLEFADWEPPEAPADVVVLAGDIHIGTRGLAWARAEFPDTPVIYVPGNHEYYGGQLQDLSDALIESADRLDIHLLDGEETIIDGTRFLGATLWTDFALYGKRREQIERSMAAAKHGMNDYHVIRHAETGTLRPEHTRATHLAQVGWLESRLAEPFDGPTVVVTHYLPHEQSLSPRFRGSSLNPAFASDLSHLVAMPVDLWIHGHTHDSCDYVVSGTRVVCNPRGYLPMEPNPDFDPAWAIDTAGLGESAGSAAVVRPNS